MLGWVAVIACDWTSATLLAHVPEPVVLHDNVGRVVGGQGSTLLAGVQANNDVLIVF
jgi:hypothetical protein